MENVNTGSVSTDAVPCEKPVALDPVTQRFTLFPQLPAELRNAIWELALPHYMENVLYVYRGNLWQRDLLGPENNIHDLYDPAFPEPKHNQILEFRFHSFCETEYTFPMTQVSREARSTALHMIRRCGLTRKAHGLFKRPFCPRRDILYVPDGMWLDFVDELWARSGPQDMNQEGGVHACVEPVSLTQMAIDERTLLEAELGDLATDYTFLTRLFVLNDPEPSFMQRLSDNARYAEFTHSRELGPIEDLLRKAGGAPLIKANFNEANFTLDMSEQGYQKKYLGHYIKLV